MLQALFLALTVLAQGPKPPERARDPWVFRSVLDQRARMVTLALHKEMWIAYDAQDCSLYKCWKGGVQLDGAVYTTVHGAQPTSRGPAYTRGADGPVWSAEVDGKPVELRAQWRGYFFHGGRAHLKFELTLPDGRKIDAQETADYFTSEQVVPETELADRALEKGMPVLYRSWLLEGVPDGVRILLALRFDNDVLRQRITGPDGVLMRERFVDETDAAGAVHTSTSSVLPFSKEQKGASVIVVFAPLPDPPPEKPPQADGGKPASGKPADAPAKDH